MKRSPLPPRTTWLHRQSRPIRRKGGHRFKGYVPNVAYRHWVRGHGCLIREQHECWGLIEFAHIVSRARGGQDEGNGVPLCTRAHREQHHGHRSFDAKYGVDCGAIASDLWTRYQEAWG